MSWLTHFPYHSPEAFEVYHSCIFWTCLISLNEVTLLGEPTCQLYQVYKCFDFVLQTWTCRCTDVQPTSSHNPFNAGCYFSVLRCFCRAEEKQGANFEGDFSCALRHESVWVDVSSDQTIGHRPLGRWRRNEWLCSSAKLVSWKTVQLHEVVQGYHKLSVDLDVFGLFGKIKPLPAAWEAKVPSFAISNLDCIHIA